MLPAARITCGFLRRFTAFCSVSAVQKWRAPSSHTATSGVTWGRPSARTVEIQNSSAPPALDASRPIRGNGVRVAEARVDFRNWFVHQKHSFRSLGDGGKAGTPGLLGRAKSTGKD